MAAAPQKLGDQRPLPRLHAVGAQRGQPDLATIYREHADFVIRTTRRLGVPEAQVEDVVHDVFLVVHRRLDDFDGRASMPSWLYGITRRVVMHHQRGYTRARAREAHAPIPNALPDAEVDLQRRRAAQAVKRCLAGLDHDQRTVFMLAEIEGLTAPEIARAHNINLNTVYSRLRLARRKFERLMTRVLGSVGSERRG